MMITLDEIGALLELATRGPLSAAERLFVAALRERIQNEVTKQAQEAEKKE